MCCIVQSGTLCKLKVLRHEYSHNTGYPGSIQPVAVIIVSRKLLLYSIEQQTLAHSGAQKHEAGSTLHPVSTGPSGRLFKNTTESRQCMGRREQWDVRDRLGGRSCRDLSDDECEHSGNELSETHC